MSTSEKDRANRCLLLDWGDTVMRVFPEFEGPMAIWPRVEAVAGVADALAALRSDWTIALATNAADSREEEIWSALARAGLDHLFDRVFCFRGVGHRKSEPGYFRTILADLGIEPHQAVMVGNDFEADVEAANRCGVRAVWLCEPKLETSSGPMYRTVQRLSELPRALELLCGWRGADPR